MIFSFIAWAAEEIKFENYGNSWAGGDGDCLEVNNDVLPVDTEVTYNGASSVRVNVTANGSWWAVLFHYLKDWSGFVDEGYIGCAIKGEVGGEEVGLGLRSGDGDTEQNVIISVKADKDWKVIRVPIKDLIEANPKK